jgi:predicted lipid-binding transport protein (Tim44 family)
MFFGATSAPAAVHDGGGDLVRQGDGTLSGSSWPFAGFLLIMLALLAGGIYYLSKRRNAHLSSAFAGLGGASPSRSEPPAWVPPSVGVLSPMSSPESKLTVHDEEKFRRLLVEIQTAWSRQDDRRLRRITTPEMFQYFSDKLTENVSAGVENRVEDVVVTGAEVRESWAEDGRLYATVLMQWKARDRVRSFANPSNDPDYEKKSDDRVSREYVEAWTFVKLREGTWLLSAIQQPE